MDAKESRRVRGTVRTWKREKQFQARRVRFKRESEQSSIAKVFENRADLANNAAFGGWVAEGVEREREREWDRQHNSENRSHACHGERTLCAHFCAFCMSAALNRESSMENGEWRRVPDLNANYGNYVHLARLKQCEQTMPREPTKPRAK